MINRRSLVLGGALVTLAAVVPGESEAVIFKHLTDGIPHHYAWSCHGGRLKLFIDGWPWREWQTGLHEFEVNYWRG